MTLLSCSLREKALGLGVQSSDASHGERSDGEYSAIGADFLSSVSEHKKSLRAVESFESPCGAAVRSRSVGDEDESRPIRLSPSRVDFRQEGENLSRAVRHSGTFYLAYLQQTLPSDS